MNVQRYRGGRGCRCPSSGIDLPSASLRGEPAARLRRARDRLHVAEHSCGGASAPSPRAAARSRGSFVRLYTTKEPRNFQLPANEPPASAGALSLGGVGVPLATGVLIFALATWRELVG